METIKLDVNAISGDIKVRENKILCVATPYSKGWKVYVDGEEKQLLCVNKHYLGVELSIGDHTVLFRYSTPLKQEGFLISLGGITALALLSICYERKRKSESR